MRAALHAERCDPEDHCAGASWGRGRCCSRGQCTEPGGWGNQGAFGESACFLTANESDVVLEVG